MKLLYLNDGVIEINNIKSADRQDMFEGMRYLGTASAGLTAFVAGAAGGLTYAATGLFGGAAYVPQAASAGAIATAAGLSLASIFLHASSQVKITGAAAALVTAFAITALPQLAKANEMPTTLAQTPSEMFDFDQWSKVVNGAPLNCMIDLQGKNVANWDGSFIDCSTYPPSEAKTIVASPSAP